MSERNREKEKGKGKGKEKHDEMTQHSQQRKSNDYDNKFE